MRPFILCLLLLSMTAATAFSQERKEITSESGGKYSSTKEDYSVLKSDNSIKDGPYRRFFNGKLILTGFYKNGQKDSVWETYNNRQVVLARKWWAQGNMVGKWEFFNGIGQPEHTYDLTSGKILYPETPKEDTTTFFYLSAGGDWVRGKLDKDPLPLFGSAEWMNYLNHTLHYPDKAVDNNIQGKVMISMIVDENGHASEYAVFQHADPTLDQEALRVVSSYEHLFLPAEKDGKKVKTLFLQPMIFKLEKAN